jgi:uncharacterized protein YqjF (DUF2071 family)
MVLTYGFPKEELLRAIPTELNLDCFEGKWAFVAVAMVQTKNLRPKGFPEFLGSNFFLIGYRVFVRYVNASGRNLRGLYILGSETDKKSMEILGNIFTHYRYHATDITFKRNGHSVEVRSARSGFNVSLEDSSGEDNPLPEGSPFSDWKQARRFAGPLPFTFSTSPERKQILIVEGVRNAWTPRPVRVLEHRVPFLNRLNADNSMLASAFIINQIPYYWKKGRIELCKT